MASSSSGRKCYASIYHSYQGKHLGVPRRRRRQPNLSATASAQTFKISIGVRETGAAVPVGDNGTATGGIEWINLDGLTLNANNTWQQFTYTFGTDPVTAFAGATANGVLDGTRGTIEHVRILNSAGTTNPITIYMDDFVNKVSGVDTVVSGFESTDPHPATSGALHMFNQPGFSGSTNGFLQNAPNTALVSDEQAHSGTQSNKVQFAFNTTSTTAWLRLTSFNAPGQPNPAIDFTAGNTLTSGCAAASRHRRTSIRSLRRKLERSGELVQRRRPRYAARDRQFPHHRNAEDRQPRPAHAGQRHHVRQRRP